LELYGTVPLIRVSDLSVSRFEQLHLTPEFLAMRSVRFFEQADRSIVVPVGLGVLFVMAFWSGPSRRAFHLLKDHLLSEDPIGRIELLVVDTDGCPDLYHAPFFPNSLNGGGETAWICQGEVIGSLGFTPEAYSQSIRSLLNWTA
jgi:hypothetical protein